MPNGGTLDGSGIITFANPQAPSVNFTVSVHDQANPFQTQTANYTINFAGASFLTFVTPPSTTTVNQPITPAVRVQASDYSEAALPGVQVTLTLSSGSGTLSGTLTQVTDATGVATFPNLSINAAGTADTLQASSGSVTATSNAFNANPLAPPTNLTAQNTGGTTVLAWSPSASNGVIGYNVYRSMTQGGLFTLLTSTPVVSSPFTDQNAPGGCPATTYYYFVTAVGTGSTESGASNQTVVTVPSGGC